MASIAETSSLSLLELMDTHLSKRNKAKPKVRDNDREHSIKR